MTTELTMSPQEREHLDAASRFDAIRKLWRDAERRRLTASILMADADRLEDWKALGLGSFSEYARGLGIPESTARKMRAVGQTFTVNVSEDEVEQLRERGAVVTAAGSRPLWDAMPEHDQQELSLERAYISHQRVKMGQVSPQDALTDAVAHPPHELLNLRDGQPQVEAQVHRCPLCNQEHVGRVASGELGGEGEEDLPF